MAELSVGYTAGLIAFGIFVAQIWVPTAIAFLLGGFLRDEETAASWSVAAKVLQSSHWTTLLRTDSVRTHAVRRPILLASLAIPMATILTAVASVITPLGLYEQLGTSGQEVGNFSYIRDTSAYFYGTSPRGVHSFSRVCYHRLNWAPCPLTNDTVVFSLGSSESTFHFPNNLTTEVPSILREVYSSGTRGIGTTVSNFFDIEWRQVTTRINDLGIVNHGRPYAVNMFRQLDTLVLGNSVRLIEGLVVDAKSGGIGFRNHTVPQPPGRNVTWQEDLLFIEPVTSCVNTNLTLDYTETLTINISSSEPGDYRLTDRGGFVHLTHKLPDYNHTNPQADPDLRTRAYRVAVLNNFATMVFFNITNPADNSTGTKAFQYLDSTFNKSFQIPPPGLGEYRAAHLSDEYGIYLSGVLGWSSSLDEGPRYSNPFNVTRKEWFQTLSQECSGYRGYQPANISDIFVKCGLLIGPPRRVDDGPQGIFERGSKWTKPIYSCATAIRAIIKTVHFSTDIASNPVHPSGDNWGLIALRVTNISDKQYPNQESYPLWGVEDTGRPVNEVAPIWGLVSPDYQDAGFPNMTVIRQPWLYLLGEPSEDSIFGHAFLPLLSDPRGDMNLPGADFPFAIANTLYTSSGVSSREWPFDLIGHSDMAVFTRWQELTTTPEGTAKMINLIWTDIAASAVVGTKGILPPLSPSSPVARRSPQEDTRLEEQPVPVIHITPVVPLTRYHTLYGIPAFALLVVLVTLTAGALAAWWTKTSTLDKMRIRLQQLSAGRIFTSVLYPSESDFRMPPKQWSRISGFKTVRFVDGEGGQESAGAGAAANREQEVLRDMQSPGAISVSSIGGDTKVEVIEEMRPIRHDSYSGGQQHGGYIALPNNG